MINGRMLCHYVQTYSSLILLTYLFSLSAQVTKGSNWLSGIISGVIIYVAIVC